MSQTSLPAYLLGPTSTCRNNTKYKIQTTGYKSGYNLTIYCDPGDTCYINCYDNACADTYLFCSDATCYTSCDYECPIEPTGEPTISPSSTSSNSFPIVTDLDSISTLLYNDDDCGTHWNALIYDLYQGSNGNTGNNLVDNDGICCRGAQSCFATDYMVVNDRLYTYDTSGSDDFYPTLSCDGYQSCWIVDNIVSNGSIYCSSAESCWQSGTINGNYFLGH